MKTVYIDVYFLINFTVDILAAFVSLKMLHTKIYMKRLIFVGVIGGLLSVIQIFVKSVLLNIILAAFFIFLISLFSCGEISLGRRIRFILLYYFSSFLIGGTVSFVYEIMDRYLHDIIKNSQDTTNRKVLIFSLIILLIIGGLRLFIMMFSDSIKEKSTRLVIKIDDKTLDLEALIDTGNLVRDPMNMNPVVFIKRICAEEIFPESVIDLCDIDNLEIGYRKRIRLIPVTRNSSTHVMTGVKVDKVFICLNSKMEEIDATVVVDKEEGTYGGFLALTPYVTTGKNA